MLHFVASCLLLGDLGVSAPIAAGTQPINIPITVLVTWSVPYAADIQDISFDWSSNELVIRSNGSGKIFLANPANCDSLGEIDLPAGSEGFGVAVNYGGYGGYYINSSTSDSIFHSDEFGNWTGFPNPAGTNGAGMDMYKDMYMDMYGENPITLCEALTAVPCSFYGMNPDGSDTTRFELPGVDSEISGLMGHQVYTDYLPFGIIVTTRFGHEFFFLGGGGPYGIVGQEPCPLSVSESLGLTWSPSSDVYWSYKGLDDQYYISCLQIPIFGAIEDNAETVFGASGVLGITDNPSAGSAGLAVNLPAASSVTLKVFSITGRLQQTLHCGMLAQGESSFSFTGPPGVYTAILEKAGSQEELRFVIAK